MRAFIGDEFQSIFDSDMYVSFEAVTDTMPVNRVKKAHALGTHAKVEWVARPGQPYTGMFKGAEFGIMRFSDTH